MRSVRVGDDHRRDGDTDCILFTTPAIVLAEILRSPRITIRELSDRLGLAERTVSRAVGSLARAGYLEIQRMGRNNEYRVSADMLKAKDSVMKLSGLLSGVRGGDGRAK